ncbi:MAG: tetratricopeptide repeat protein [Flammeovirgaceae bacterium]|nr:tetratricopeptide repeat protein [Flammeovirgaceae bacterium]
MINTLLIRMFLIVLSVFSFTNVSQAQVDDVVNYNENTLKYNLYGDPNLVLGNEFLEAGAYGQAKKYFEKAIEQDSLNPLAYENLGIVLKRLNDHKGILACFKKGKRIFNDKPDFFYFSGDANQKLGNYAAAIKDYTDAIAISGNASDVELLYLYYFNRGNTYIKTRKYNQAKKDFDQVIALDPYHYGAFTNRGMAKYNLKDKAGACSDWGKAYEYGNSKTITYLKKYCKEGKAGLN